tara:strand:- start:312 stop:476 length:165 start_codon:yes stop_codon:yes gene_type:complete
MMNVLRTIFIIAVVSCGAGSKITLVEDSLGNSQNLQSTSNRFGECKIGECRFEN